MSAARRLSKKSAQSPTRNPTRLETTKTKATIITMVPDLTMIGLIDANKILMVAVVAL
jgi:hypothetical protein